MNTRHGRLLVSSSVNSNQPAEAHSVVRSTLISSSISTLKPYLYQYAYFLVVPIAEDHELLNSISINKIFVLHMFDLRKLPYIIL